MPRILPRDYLGLLPESLAARGFYAGIITPDKTELFLHAPLVRVEADGHVFLLFTNLADMPAELVALTYRYRWQIELFFKWLKCILGCRHWFAESQAGVTIQVYCALIASVLLVLWTGRKPTKRQWEMLQLYWMGVADLEELERALRPVTKRKKP